MNENELLLRLGYVLLCGALLWAFICRFSKMDGASTRRAVRWIYCLSGSLVFNAMLLPFWQRDWGEWGALSLGTAHLLTTISNSRAWRFGPPEHARTRPAPLIDAVPEALPKGPMT